MNSHAREMRHRALHGFCILLGLILIALYAVVALLYLMGDGLKILLQRCWRALRWLDRWSIRGL